MQEGRQVAQDMNWTRIHARGKSGHGMVGRCNVHIGIEEGLRLANIGVGQSRGENREKCSNSQSHELAWSGCYERKEEKAYKEADRSADVASCKDKQSIPPTDCRQQGNTTLVKPLIDII